VTCHILLKTINKSYNFALDLISIGGLQRKLWAHKVAGISTLTISKLPFGSPGTKCHLDVALMKRHKIYYRGNMVASLKFGPW
jgi:hypothetical protein